MQFSLEEYEKAYRTLTEFVATITPDEAEIVKQNAVAMCIFADTLEEYYRQEDTGKITIVLSQLAIWGMRHAASVSLIDWDDAPSDIPDD